MVGKKVANFCPSKFILPVYTIYLILGMTDGRGSIVETVKYQSKVKKRGGTSQMNQAS